MTKSTGAMVASKSFLRFGVSLTAVALAAGAVALPVAAQDAPTATADDEAIIVVTGFRGSLQTAISEKKRSNDMVDVIKAEDIGQFPDLNLAESLQRIPGVAIDRDGGEGRQITIRGLNSEFSRTRLNGLEALATGGGKDGSAGTNRGRGFDYNVFAADLFSSLTVRKSVSAEVDEGSLGATVDLQTARPFDYKGFTAAASISAGYNDISEKSTPRGTFMISNRWADGKLGALLSVAYEQRPSTEDSLTTTRWQNAYSAGNSGRFQSYSTDGGATFNPIAPCTSNATTKVCNTTASSNPALTDPEAIKVTDALFPRIPRYNTYNYDIERLGVTAAFQMRPHPDTLITVEALMANFQQDREEYEIEAISFSRNTAGVPQTDIYDYTISPEKVITKASFNDVDIRSEHRFDELTTDFTQVSVTWDQDWSSRLSTKLSIGASKSDQDNPQQTTFTFESYNVQGYSYDYTNPTAPVFDYGTSSTGCNPDQACYWTYAAASSNTSATNANGDASLIRMAPNRTVNTFANAKFDAKFEVNDNLTLRAGIVARGYEFDTVQFGRYTTTPLTRYESTGLAGPTNVIQSTINGNIAGYSESRTVNGVTFLIPNLDKITEDFDIYCNCTNQFGTFTINSTNSNVRGNTRHATEDTISSYVQADYRGSIAGMEYRGNAGVRFVKTDMTAEGYFAVTPTTVSRSYEDTLPSFNFMIEPHENLFVRFAASKTMSRPTLLSLAPGGTVSVGGNTISTGNPALDPTRSDNLDLSVEWYADRDTLITASVFKKDIKSYIQRSVTQGTLADYGFDAAELGEANPGEIYTVTAPINTPGGELKGYEINIQRPFNFLPGFLANTGGIFNYTNVDSEIDYIVTPSLTAPVIRRDKLLGLSPVSYNATIYYEDDRFNARVSFAHRDGYISQLNPGSGAIQWGKHATDNLDAQVSYKLNKNLTVSLEMVNLTNEPDSRYIVYDTPQGNKIEDLVYEYAETGRQFYLGAKYKY